MGIFFRPGLFPPTTGAAEPWRPWRSLSGDVTGAPVLFYFIALPTLFLFRVHAPYPFLMIRNTIHLCLPRLSALQSAQIWSVLPSAPLVVSWFSWYVALLGSWDRFVCSAPVGPSCCLPGSVALLSVLGWALLLLSYSSPFVWLLSLPFFAFPRPAVCLVWCPGPVRTWVCWYVPLGILLQLWRLSCLACMLGVWLFFVILPSYVPWQRRLLALCVVFTLHAMLQVTSGSMVRPYWGIHEDDDPVLILDFAGLHYC